MKVLIVIALVVLSNTGTLAHAPIHAPTATLVTTVSGSAGIIG